MDEIRHTDSLRGSRKSRSRGPVAVIFGGFGKSTEIARFGKIPTCREDAENRVRGDHDIKLKRVGRIALEGH